MNRKNRNSYLQFITSMLIFGTIGIFRKYIPLSSGMLAFTRGVLGCVFLLLFMRIKNDRKIELPDRRNRILLAVTGALIGLNWIFLFESYRYTSVTVATMCYYMQPTIVILLSPLVFKEKLTIKKLCCAVTAIIGMFFVSGMMDGNGIGAADTTGILCGLAAAALYASVIILNKKIQVDDAYLKTMVQLGAAALVLVPYLLAAEDFGAISLHLQSVIMVLIVGIVHTGIAYVLYFGSMRDLQAQSIAVLSYIDPVFALFLSALLLHETLSIFGIIGAILIIGSALISELTGENK